MNNFNSHAILENNEIIAKELKRARLGKKISLQEASSQLKMNIVYLEALEVGDFEALPTGVYRHNFLREYAIFLGLSASDLIGLFSQDKVKKTSKSQEDLFVKKASHVHYFVTIPRLVRNLLIFSASAVCIIYLGICINAIISPPELIVNSPSLDIVTEEKEIIVEGVTDPEAELTINNELVLADSLGAFSKKVNLKNGINTITIVAHKKYSRRNELVKKVLVDTNQG